MSNGVKVATLVLLVKDDEILLAMKKRGFGAGRWNGAGGKVQAGESIEQAMLREAHEEIGVTPLQYHKVAIHNFAFPDGTLDMQGHTYLCHEWAGKPHETEEMAPRWFKIADIPYDQMWQDDILWLPEVLQGRKLHTTFTFDQHDNMLSHHIKVVNHL